MGVFKMLSEALCSEYGTDEPKKVAVAVLREKAGQIIENGEQSPRLAEALEFTAEVLENEEV